VLCADSVGSSSIRTTRPRSIYCTPDALNE
jgi:hypothetical protein